MGVLGGLAAVCWFSVGGGSRIIREHSFNIASIVGIAPDGRLAVFDTNGLAFIDEHGEVQSVPVSSAVPWIGYPVTLAGTNGMVIYQMLPGGGSSLRMLDWSGKEKWAFQTNVFIGLPTSDAIGNVSFISSMLGTNQEVHSIDPAGRTRWTFGYATWSGGTYGQAPVMSPDGRLAIVGDRRSGVIMLDSNGGEQWRYPAINGNVTLTAGAFAPGGDLLIRDGLQLLRFDPKGNLKWRLALADAVGDRGAVGYEVLTPKFGPDGVVYCPIGRWIFAVTANGVLKWQFRRDGIDSKYSNVVMGWPQDWGTLNADGELIVVAGDWESAPVTMPGGAVGSIVLANNERLSCLSSEGVLKWEQTLPSSMVWSLPRNRLDLTMLWKSRMGLRASKGLGRPTISSNGMIYLSGWSKGQATIWTIRGD